MQVIYEEEPQVKLWKLADDSIRMARYVRTKSGLIQAQRAYIVRSDGFDNWVYWAPMDNAMSIVPALVLETAMQGPFSTSAGDPPPETKPAPPLTLDQARAMDQA